MIKTLNNFFKLKERETNISTEILAGVTTFLTMVYIVIVNPAILSNAGMDFNGVYVATILATMIGTLIMGIFSNYPIAISTGMGINAYFAFTVAGQHGWEIALGTVFVAGVIFMILSLTKFRHILIDAIPNSLKYSITAGIGLFITFIGLQQAGVIVDSDATLVTLGNLAEPSVVIALTGLITTLLFMMYRVKGALIFGMLLSSLLAYFMGILELPTKIFGMPTGLSNVAFELDILGVFSNGLYGVVFTFLLIILFDTTGTMLGIAEQAGLIKKGKFKGAKSALLADATATTVGAMVGTSPTSAYIESGSGVAVGGRTGLTAVVVTILFGVTLFLSPLASVLASVPAITSPALIIVGFLMISVLRKMDWEDISEAFPAFVVLVSMPLTYSIATGIGLGFILYPVLKVLKGKGKEVHPILYVFAVLFAIQIIILGH